MTATLDATMETASQALAEMDYARCEALCVDVLARARDARDWGLYRRVLLPLQESRRQRRQAAIDGLILLGTPEKQGDAAARLADARLGCVVLTRPYEPADAAALDAETRRARRAAEVLYADNPAEAGTWTITTFRGPAIGAELPAPPSAWVGQATDPMAIQPPTPAHWFMRASEALGDAAIAAIDAEPGTTDHLAQLEAALDAVGDHELLHQRLADAAKALQEAGR